MMNNGLTEEVNCVYIPRLASNKNLAGVHDTTGQASSMDGAEGRTELDDVGPDQ